MPRLVRIPEAVVKAPAHKSEALATDLQPKITDHFRPNTEEVAKKKRGRRAKKRAAVTAKKSITISEVRPRNKEQRKAAKALHLSKPPPESLLPDSPAGRVKKRHAHKAVSKAKWKITHATTNKKRKNWSKDPALAEAVKLYWSSRADGKPRTVQQIAREAGIPPGTLGNYINSDPTKRRKLGGQVGRKSILTEENSEFLCQVAIRADRANKGLTPAEVQANMRRLVPGMTELQSRNAYYHKFLKDHRGRIKQKAVKAQGTSTRRSCCTVAQQFRWHNLVEEGLNFLREHNTGLCKKSGKTFGEVIMHSRAFWISSR
jgi:hypothetical protein